MIIIGLLSTLNLQAGGQVVHKDLRTARKVRTGKSSRVAPRTFINSFFFFFLGGGVRV